MTTPDLQSRLQASLKTGTGCFSQVTAVTQGAINSGLRMLYELNPEFVEINHKNNRFGEINAVLSAGTISIPVVGNDFDKLYYHCNFSSGKLMILQEDESTSQIDMKDWCFVFGLNIGMAKVPKEDPDYNDLRELINQPGDYSITRLFLNFSTHQAMNFNRTLSSFNGHQWESEEDRLIFATMMGSEIAKVQNNTIGYAISTNRPESVNNQAPTFPPTSLLLQHCPYRDLNDNRTYGGASENGDRNMLFYLEMTNNQPAPLERALFPSGNLVAPGMSGTICISKGNFWNNFLLRTKKSGLPQLLSIFNEATFAWCRSVTIANGADCGVGPGSGLDTDENFYAWKEDGELAWVWDNDYDQRAVEGLEDVFDNTMQCICATHNKIIITPGTNRARLSGKTRMKLKQNRHIALPAIGFEAVAGFEWGLDLTLNSVYQGGLEISLNLPENPQDAFKLTDPHQNNWPQYLTTNEESQKLLNFLKASIDKAPFREAQDTLATALQGTARFVLPGARTFFYKNPIFNNYGDVLIQLEYDGV